MADSNGWQISKLNAGLESNVTNATPINDGTLPIRNPASKLISRSGFTERYVAEAAIIMFQVTCYLARSSIDVEQCCRRSSPYASLIASDNQAIFAVGAIMMRSAPPVANLLRA